MCFENTRSRALLGQAGSGLGRIGRLDRRREVSYSTNAPGTPELLRRDRSVASAHERTATAPPMRQRVTAAVLLASALAGGCGSSRSAPAGTAHVNPHYGAPGARIAFLRPVRGSTVAQPVRVKVAVTGFKLDPTNLDKAPEKGHGALLFSMDGGRFDTPRYAGANGELAAHLGVAGKYSPAVRPEITYKDLPAGRHTLVASLANNDLSHTGVRARVEFTVH
jgi:hypothetical protein